ncbi:MAG TPA: serine hydrolase [Nevskiaceae bacterium]|nr:serine hydrolase [Nevskiaceae bacterium]
MAPEKIEDEKFPLKPIKKPKKKKPFRPADRWLIVGIFLLTVLASLVFYFKAEAANFWQKLTSPLIISNVSKKDIFDPTPVLEEIENLTKNLRGVYGVYVYRLNDGHEYGVYQEEIFPAASLMKLPVMLALYQETEEGNLTLETQYTLKEVDKRGGAGTLQGKKAGSVYTYRQLAGFMGQYSDNTAFNVIVEILGAGRIQQTIDNLGMTKTSFEEFETSPKDVGLFFQKLYQSNIVNHEHRDEILEFLTKTTFEDRIPAGVPENIRVAHKIGTELGNYSDAGIVFADKPFVLVIITKNAREAEALEVLPQITQKVWEFEVGSET